jgi:hypothetical protein
VIIIDWSRLEEAGREKQVLLMEVENLKAVGEQLVSELVITASELTQALSSPSITTLAPSPSPCGQEFEEFKLSPYRQGGEGVQVTHHHRAPHFACVMAHLVPGQSMMAMGQGLETGSYEKMPSLEDRLLEARGSTDSKVGAGAGVRSCKGIILSPI